MKRFITIVGKIWLTLMILSTIIGGTVSIIRILVGGLLAAITQQPIVLVPLLMPLLVALALVVITKLAGRRSDYSWDTRKAIPTAWCFTFIFCVSVYSTSMISFVAESLKQVDKPKTVTVSKQVERFPAIPESSARRMW